jgi:hypothetical protein
MTDIDIPGEAVDDRLRRMSPLRSDIAVKPGSRPGRCTTWDGAMPVGQSMRGNTEGSEGSEKRSD